MLIHLSQPGIFIQFIPHQEQRYDTCGDWFYEGPHLFIRVSNNLPEYASRIEQEAVALHELTEALLCRHRGVTQKMVDEFDFKWQNGQAEPGDNPDAPYHRQHEVADIVERVYLHEAQGYNLAHTHKEVK